MFSNFHNVRNAQDLECLSFKGLKVYIHTAEIAAKNKADLCEAIRERNKARAQKGTRQYYDYLRKLESEITYIRDMQETARTIIDRRFSAAGLPEVAQ